MDALRAASRCACPSSERAPNERDEQSDEHEVADEHEPADSSQIDDVPVARREPELRQDKGRHEQHAWFRDPRRRPRAARVERARSGTAARGPFRTRRRRRPPQPSRRGARRSGRGLARLRPRPPRRRRSEEASEARPVDPEASRKRSVTRRSRRRSVRTARAACPPGGAPPRDSRSGVAGPSGVRCSPTRLREQGEETAGSTTGGHPRRRRELRGRSGARAGRRRRVPPAAGRQDRASRPSRGRERRGRAGHGR